LAIHESVGKHLAGIKSKVNQVVPEAARILFLFLF